MNANSGADQIIKDFSVQRPIRAGSFITTLYGDALLPRNAGIWTGYIIELCGLVGISESLARTAISRLVADQRLKGVKIGRKSYYHLTESSRREFQHAVKRLYSGERENGELWTFVLNLDATKREEVKRGLERIGFGAPTYGLFMKPGDCRVELDYSFGPSLGDSGNMIFNARLEDVLDDKRIKNLLSIAWDTARIEKYYQAFCDKFDPVFACLKQGQKLSDVNSFLVRQVLVHEYRKIALKDPWLPLAMLPENWVGLRGFTLFSKLYDILLAQSESYLDQLLIDIQQDT